MLPLVVIWLHILAAVVWIGGMMFLSLVLAPLVRRENTVPGYTVLFRSAAQRFRLIVWLAIGILLSTGPVLLRGRGISSIDMTQWPPVFLFKAALVVVLLLLTFLHDLLLGPLVSRNSTIPARVRTVGEQIFMRASRWVPRLALAVALGVLFVAVIFVRS
ncbi:MAG TPA: hypothetical protein VEI50_05485 [Nitrospiraceae bacterium]|nr:hypothetical protein [Nitrospiraceae bacterium]